MTAQHPHRTHPCLLLVSKVKPELDPQAIVALVDADMAGLRLGPQLLDRLVRPHAGYLQQKRQVTLGEWLHGMLPAIALPGLLGREHPVVEAVGLGIYCEGTGIRLHLGPVKIGMISSIGANLAKVFCHEEILKYKSLVNLCKVRAD